MTRHRTDLLALLFGLSFAIAGTIVIVTQATNVDVSPQWGTAVGLILLGVVALVATVARVGTGGLDPGPFPTQTTSPVEANVEGDLVSSEDPAD